MVTVMPNPDIVTPVWLIQQPCRLVTPRPGSIRWLVDGDTCHGDAFPEWGSRFGQTAEAPYHEMW
jgi:hypothetical protein